MRRALVTLALALPLLAACQLSLPGRDRAPDMAESPAAVMGEAITTTTLDAPATAAASALPAATTKAPPRAPKAAAATPEPAAEPTADPAPAPAAEAPAPLATPIPKSPSQIACEKDKGIWTKTGQGEARACIRKTRDSGKACDSKTDCQGECLARSRTCAPFRPMFGCNAVLMDNGAEVTLCLD
jgi:hypothetical protein